jgi:hypothetical protein
MCDDNGGDDGGDDSFKERLSQAIQQSLGEERPASRQNEIILLCDSSDDEVEEETAAADRKQPAITKPSTNNKGEDEDIQAYQVNNRKQPPLQKEGKIRTSVASLTTTATNASTAASNFSTQRKNILNNIAELRGQIKVSETEEENDVFRFALQLEIAGLKKLNKDESDSMRYLHTMKDEGQPTATVTTAVTTSYLLQDSIISPPFIPTNNFNIGKTVATTAAANTSIAAAASLKTRHH